LKAALMEMRLPVAISTKERVGKDFPWKMYPKSLTKVIKFG
jgi:hypothetical protein